MLHRRQPTRHPKHCCAGSHENSNDDEWEGDASIHDRCECSRNPPGCLLSAVGYGWALPRTPRGAVLGPRTWCNPGRTGKGSPSLTRTGRSLKQPVWQLATAAALGVPLERYDFEKVRESWGSRTQELTSAAPRWRLGPSRTGTVPTARFRGHRGLLLAIGLSSRQLIFSGS